MASEQLDAWPNLTIYGVLTGPNRSTEAANYVASEQLNAWPNLTICGVLTGPKG